MLVSLLGLLLAFEGDGLSTRQRELCDSGDEYVASHYEVCCSEGRYRWRRDACSAAAPVVEDDERTPAYPKLSSRVSAPCTACARLVDNFNMGLLPRLAERQKQLQRHHSRTRLQRSSTIGELELIVEEEVERICSWPRTFHQPNVRKACTRLVEERSDEFVAAISGWARDGSYGLELGEALSDELRPALCEAELHVCTARELDELLDVDADEEEKLRVANETGHSAEHPLESEIPSDAKEGVLLRVVGEDFIKRVVEEGEQLDYLVYMYFPGRTAEVDDTHARFRAKFIRLAEFLDAPGSNGSLAVGWMDCVFNQIPHPHGVHVHADTIALYGARSKGRPKYWLDLRAGDVELHELIDFVHDASENAATRAHVARRAEALGARGIRETLPRRLLSFDESLGIDERNLLPADLTSLKEEL
jgi:hypothetical protein